MVRKPLNVDKAISQKERLTYARVFVEDSINHSYLTSVMFENEHGTIIEQEVCYEWNLVLCSKYKNFGHEVKECRKILKGEVDKEI